MKRYKLLDGQMVEHEDGELVKYVDLFPNVDVLSSHVINCSSYMNIPPRIPTPETPHVSTRRPAEEEPHD